MTVSTLVHEQFVSRCSADGLSRHHPGSWLFFCPQIEVRPLGMSKAWANEYFFKPLQWERLLHWYGVDVHGPSNSKPSRMEQERDSLLNEKVG